jgi:hypothetical protein
MFADIVGACNVHLGPSVSKKRMIFERGEDVRRDHIAGGIRAGRRYRHSNEKTLVAIIKMAENMVHFIVGGSG